jgi:hypothetical protein
MIGNWKIRKLITLGDDYRCPLLLPPFDKNTNEASYEITQFKDTPAFQTFLKHIASLDLPFEYAKKNDKMFLVVKIDEDTNCSDYGDEI